MEDWLKFQDDDEDLLDERPKEEKDEGTEEVETEEEYW